MTNKMLVPQKRRRQTTIHDLSDELLAEILCRVPIKLAVRCKCVSKRWFSLVSNPRFVSRFVSHRATDDEYSLSSALVLVGYYVQDIKPACFASPWIQKELELNKSFSLDFLPCYTEGNHFCLLGSCHELLLCSGACVEQSVYTVCNPVTKQYIDLPPSPNLHDRVDVGFICEPYYHVEDGKKEGTVVVNMTITQRTFKVVRIPHKFKDDVLNNFNMEIFSSETGEWRVLAMSCPQGFHLDTWLLRATPYNGNLWWLCSAQGLLVYNPFGNDAGLEHGDNQCSFLSLPKEIGEYSYSTGRLKLGVCKGRLRLANMVDRSIIDDQDPGLPLILFIWEFDQSTGKWSLVHMVNMAKYDMWLSVLAFHPDDEDKIFLWVDGDIVALYDMIHKTFVEGQCQPLSEKLSRQDDLICYNPVPFMLPLWPCAPIPPVQQAALP